MSVVPDKPTVLNTTAPSNFAYIDRIDLLEDLPRVCSVPEVRRELSDGAVSYPYLDRALESLDEPIPIVELDEQINERLEALERRLDPGEAQAFAVAEIYDGTLVTDDGPARALARSQTVKVTGSIGVLVRSVENGQVSEEEADGWLKQWIDETSYRAPSREFQDFL